MREIGGLPEARTDHRSSPEPVKLMQIREFYKVMTRKLKKTAPKYAFEIFEVASPIKFTVFKNFHNISSMIR